MHPTARQPRHSPSTGQPAATPHVIEVPAAGAGQRRVTPQVRDTIVRLYDDGEGLTIRAIAADLSLAYGTVHRALWNANVQMRERGGSTHRAAGTSRPDRRRPGGHLMPRELEVLRHVVAGNGDEATVAALMSTSPSAVHGLWTRLLTRLRVGNRAQAVCYAYDRALIDLGPQPIHTPRLTTQETALLRHLADGATHSDLSARLGVTAAALYTRRRHLYAKLGAHTAPQAIALAYQHRILIPHGPPHHVTHRAPDTPHPPQPNNHPVPNADEIPGEPRRAYRHTSRAPAHATHPSPRTRP